jgi:hypothetical protein
VPAALASIGAQDLRPGTQSLRVPCRTCHSLGESRKLPSSTADLRLFHIGLTLQHGDLACAACHAEGNPPRLHLATGAPLPMAEAMTLCGQCHGPQLRDYRHGAHGGMTGYWDRSRGPRERNHCIDCHDAHAPAYVGGRPVFAPKGAGSRDRS